MNIPLLILWIAAAVVVLKWTVTLGVTCVEEWRDARREERIAQALRELVFTMQKVQRRRKQDWSPREDPNGIVR